MLLVLCISFPNSPAAAGQVAWERAGMEAELPDTPFPIGDWERENTLGVLRVLAVHPASHPVHQPVAQLARQAGFQNLIRRSLNIVL